MTTQTEAERLADELDVFATWRDDSTNTLTKSAAELRRQASFINDLKDEVVEQCRINGMSAEREDALRAEVDRLNQALTWEQNRSERISTHGPGCHTWGSQHYECLLREFQKRVWVGLTDELIDAVTDAQWAKGVNKPIYAAHRAYARAIEAKLREKNSLTSG